MAHPDFKLKCSRCHGSEPEVKFRLRVIRRGHGWCTKCSRLNSRSSIAYLRKKTEGKAPDKKSTLRKRLVTKRAHRNAFTAKRRCDELRATPRWVDLRAIRSVYEECLRMAREDGIEYHVDHIVPLRGKTVCGLHVPWNLRVIPATENLKKGARLIGA